MIERKSVWLLVIKTRIRYFASATNLLLFTRVDDWEMVAALRYDEIWIGGLTLKILLIATVSET